MGPSNICEVTDGKRRTPGRTEAFGGRSVCTRLPRPDSRRRPPGPSSGVSGGASLLHWHVGLGSAPVQVVVRDSSPANYWAVVSIPLKTLRKALKDTPLQ